MPHNKTSRRVLVDLTPDDDRVIESIRAEKPYIRSLSAAISFALAECASRPIKKREPADGQGKPETRRTITDLSPEDERTIAAIRERNPHVTSISAAVSFALNEYAHPLQSRRVRPAHAEHVPA